MQVNLRGMKDRKVFSDTPVVTIDGPAGSGKGTIAQSVARQLGWHILDSGALYRLVALAAIKRGLVLENLSKVDEDQLGEIAQQLNVVFKPKPEGGVRILLDNHDVTREIRSEACGSGASRVAAVSKVRSALLERQRRFLEPPGLIADGRDMGTVVFPQAGVKIFLTATADIRARRRQLQLKEQGIDANLTGLIRDIEIRDKRDRERQDAPLKPAPDALIIDTGKMSIDEVSEQVLDAIVSHYPMVKPLLSGESS